MISFSTLYRCMEVQDVQKKNNETVSLVLRGDNESKIQNHCFIFWFPRDLNSGTYALGNFILLFTEFLSMFEC